MDDAHCPYKYCIPSCHTAPKKTKKSNICQRTLPATFQHKGDFLLMGAPSFLAACYSSPDSSI